MIGPLFGEFVIGAVPDPGLFDETELFEHLERPVDRREVEARVLPSDVAQDVRSAEVLLALPQGVPDQLALHRQPVGGRMERFGRRRQVAHRLIVAGLSTSTTGRSPDVAPLSSSRKKITQIAAK